MMNKVGRQFGRKARISAAILLLGCAFTLSQVGRSLAVIVELTDRSITIGTPVASATTSHTFNFNFANPVDVGSIQFQYCTSPLEGVPCTAPNGLNAAGAALAAQTGATGFGLLSATANNLIITRAPTVSASGMAMMEFTNIVDPSDIGPFYVRISTYTTQDATGTEDAYGAVVSSITQGVSITTQVPPTLEFCVGITIPGDCSTATDNLVELGYLNSSTASAGSSQMEVATNAANGASITAQGTTMTSGNNEITALTVPTVSAPGNSQFGINLRANANPAIGSDPTGPGVMQPSPNYNHANEFMFQDGDVLATTTGTTDVRTFTVSYLVNVNPDQAPGVYNTTITYICTATF